MSNVEDRVTLLEHDMANVRDILEQLAKDHDLTNVNIMRTLKPNNQGEKPTSQQASTVQELTFTTLKFDSMKGEKLGEYEIAYKTNNIADKFMQAYNILKASNSTIKDRYHGSSYEFSYWIYGEGKIYRQKLKER